jgi:uncharacterized membrane protein YhaH (DUF805 family)
MEWMILPYKRYAEFTGRSRRMEYWMFSLFTLIISIVLVMLMFAGGIGMGTLAGTAPPPQELGAMFYLGAGLLAIFTLGSLVPAIAVTVRRFHDRDMSGWWLLGFVVLGMIPLVGFIASIAQIVLMALPGTKGPNRFGEDPLDPNSADVFA